METTSSKDTSLRFSIMMDHVAPRLASSRAAFRRHHREIKRRDIKPQNPLRPSLAKLNQDVLALIIQHLYDTNPETLDRVALVCSALYGLARYARWQELHIDLREPNCLLSLITLSQRGFLPALRRLHVHVSDRIEPSSVKQVKNASRLSRHERNQLEKQANTWRQLSELIPTIPGLRDLYWQGAVLPNEVLSYLGDNPQTRLHLSLQAAILDGYSKSDLFEPQLLLLEQLAAGLADIKSLSSLRIKIEYCPVDSPRVKTAQVPLKRLLVSSTGLRSLSMHVKGYEGGCVDYGPDPLYCGIGFTRGEIPPPLRELEITHYPWGMASRPGDRFQWNCIGYPAPTGTEPEYWAQNMDWSQLHRLVLRLPVNGPYSHGFPSLAQQLTALEEIELLPSHYDECPSRDSRHHDGSDQTEFLNHVPSLLLASISLSRMPPGGTSAIQVNAARLHSLAITRTILSHQELIILRDSLPRLSALTVVCAREGDEWPDDTFSLLASFPRLHSLTTWFEIGPYDEPFKPFLTVSSAATIFSRLRQLGASGLGQLQTYYGFPPRPLVGYPSLRGGASWGRIDQPIRFLCREDGGDGQSPKVTCLDLTSAENERLRNVARGKAVLTASDRENVKFVFALHGPLSASEWADTTRTLLGVSQRGPLPGLSAIRGLMFSRTEGSSRN